MFLVGVSRVYFSVYFLLLRSFSCKHGYNYAIRLIQSLPLSFNKREQAVVSKFLVFRLFFFNEFYS